MQKFRVLRHRKAGESSKIIKFVDLLETAHRDLVAMGLESEIENAHTVSIIENKLPKSLQIEWYRQIYRQDSTVNTSAKFPHLLRFLCAERDAIEYATSDLRNHERKSSSHIHAIHTAVDDCCVIHFWSITHSTANCRTYNNLSIDNKFNVLKEKAACFSCLIPGHTLKECTVKSVCGDNCSEFHHPSLHTEVASVQSHTIVDINYNPGHVLLPIMKIIPDSKRCSYLSCLWDAGADISLITFSKARQLKLYGKPAKLHITTASGQKSILDSHEYKLILQDKFQLTHIMKVYGIAKITNNIAAIDMKSIVAQFKNVNLGDIERPSGEVNLLIGYDYAGWHPTSEQVHEHLIILSNIFGKCVGGRYPSLKEVTQKYISPFICPFRSIGKHSRRIYDD